MKGSIESATRGASRVWNGRYRMAVSPGHSLNGS
nr:MAG TPA: hypothetical protein [Bacteriophage sp.]